VRAFPRVTERVSHGVPCFFVDDRRPLCYFHDHHNGDERVTVWCPLPEGFQELFVSSRPDRYFAPPSSASGTFSTWLGVVLDAATADDWAEISDTLEQAYRHVAPAHLVALLDQR